MKVKKRVKRKVKTPLSVLLLIVMSLSMLIGCEGGSVSIYDFDTGNVIEEVPKSEFEDNVSYADLGKDAKYVKLTGNVFIIKSTSTSTMGVMALNNNNSELIWFLVPAEVVEGGDPIIEESVVTFYGLNSGPYYNNLDLPMYPLVGIYEYKVK